MRHRQVALETEIYRYLWGARGWTDTRDISVALMPSQRYWFRWRRAWMLTTLHAQVVVICMLLETSGVLMSCDKEPPASGRLYRIRIR